MLVHAEDFSSAISCRKSAPEDWDNSSEPMARKAGPRNVLEVSGLSAQLHFCKESIPERNVIPGNLTGSSSDFSKSNSWCNSVIKCISCV